MAENTWITFSSQFLHNVVKTEFCQFLLYDADILSNLLVNSGSHLYEKVMKLWCVQICTHFLAHFIWILPPCKKVDDHLRWWWRMTVCPGLLIGAKFSKRRQKTDRRRRRDNDEWTSGGTGKRLLSFVKLSLHHFIHVLIDGVEIEVYIETFVNLNQNINEMV